MAGGDGVALSAGLARRPGRVLRRGARVATDLAAIAVGRSDRGGLVRSYREWRQRLLADLADGRITRKTRRELAAMAAELQRQARGDATVDIHLSYAADWKALIEAVTGNPAALLAGASVTADVNEKSLRYRIATVLPGRGYRKLISRLVASQQEYFAIDRAMRNVWYGEGGTGGR
jgi:hypothetical protein